MANFTGFENGKSYTLENLTTGKMLNLYGGRTDPGTNVCQYTADNSDDQKWTFFNNKFYAYGSSEKCLDKYTSSGNAKNNNADIWKNNDDENQIVEIIRVTVKTGLVIIKLKQGNYYLTAYTGKDYPGDRNMNLTANTDAGKTPTSAGNVYWADNSEGACIWIANEVDTSTGGETPTPDPEPSGKITVTGIPCNDSSETFHPQSGMVSGSWEENNGTEKAAAVKRLYEGVFNLDSSSPCMYMYNIFGKKYPDSLTNYNKLFHTGIDMDNYRNAPVYSYCDGEVVRDGTSDSYKAVGIYNESDKVTFYYLHMTDIPNRSVGSKVQKGDLIGYQFSSGLSDPKGTVDHLHVEAHKGRYTGYPAHLPLINEDLVSISPYQYL